MLLTQARRRLAMGAIVSCRGKHSRTRKQARLKIITLFSLSLSRRVSLGSGPADGERLEVEVSLATPSAVALLESVNSFVCSIERPGKCTLAPQWVSEFSTDDVRVYN